MKDKNIPTKNNKPKKTVNKPNKPKPVSNKPKQSKVVPKQIKKVEIEKKEVVKKTVIVENKAKEIEKKPIPVLNKPKKDSKINKEESVIDLLSLRINETLKTERKNTSPKNNPYFWIIKAFLLLVSIFIISSIFNGLKIAGTEIIYEINRSLRSVLSSVWIFTVVFMKNIIILYLVYNNLSLFVKSQYYERLYSKDREMNLKKEMFFETVLKILRMIAIVFLIGLLLVAISATFIFFYFIFIWVNGTKIISPFIISIAILFIALLAYRHILVGFFNFKQNINKRCYTLGMLLVLFGTTLLFFELKDFKYSNTLPESFETKVKYTQFDISRKDKVIIKNKSKLNNIKIQTNDSLGDEIQIYVEYYKTARVKYVYEYNDDNNLVIKFDSYTKYNLSDVPDTLGMIEKGLIDKTIYNFNLYKYPNIKIFVNTHNADRIFLK